MFDLELSISSGGSSEEMRIVPVVMFILYRMPLPKHCRGFLLFRSACVTQLLKGTTEFCVSYSYRHVLIQDWCLSALKSFNSYHSNCLK